MSRITYGWATGLIMTGFKRSLGDDELWKLARGLDSVSAGKQLRAAWKRELLSSDDDDKKHQPSFTRALWRAYWKKICLMFILKMVYLLSVLLTNVVVLPMLLRSLPEPGATVKLILLSIAFGVTESVRSLVINWHWTEAITLGLTCRAAARDLIGEKLLTLRHGQVESGRRFGR